MTHADDLAYGHSAISLTGHEAASAYRKPTRGAFGNHRIERHVPKLMHDARVMLQFVREPDQ
jgi:hypothetical protein